jgi:Zn-finger protein
VRNDYSVGGETYSCIDCFIEHTSKNWEAVVTEVFELIRKISVQWEIKLQGQLSHNQ